MKANHFLKIIASMFVGIGIVIGAIILYNNHQTRKIPELSFQEALAYTTKDNPNAVITVGIIKDGNTTFTVYGENGEKLPG